MANKRIGWLVTTFSCFLSLPIQGIAGPACADASGTYTDTLGEFIQLSQDSGGNITGGFASSGGNTCPPAQAPRYNLQGSYTGDGNFTVVGTATTQVSGCPTTITFKGSISGGGCDDVSISFTNNLGGIGFGAWTEACQVPPNETTTWKGWAPGQPTVGAFRGTMNPMSFNFGGRTWQETFPQGGFDSCWFNNTGGIPFFSPQASSPSTLAATDNNSYEDDVGDANGNKNLPSNTIAYYRRAGRAPCSYGGVQSMIIACDTYSSVYQKNTLSINIGTTTYSVSRGAVSSPVIVIGTSQPSDEAEVTIIAFAAVTQ
jgi:hypothetical protein